MAITITELLLMGMDQPKSLHQVQQSILFSVKQPLDATTIACYTSKPQLSVWARLLMLLFAMFGFSNSQNYEYADVGVWAIKPDFDYSLKRKCVERQFPSTSVLVVGGWLRSSSTKRFELEKLQNEFQVCQPTGPGTSEILTRCTKSTSASSFTPHFAAQEWVFIMFTYTSLQFKETIFLNQYCEPAVLDSMYTSSRIYTSGGGQETDELEIEISGDGESTKKVKFPDEDYIRYSGLFAGVVPSNVLEEILLQYLMSGFSRGVSVRRNFLIDQSFVSIPAGSFTPQSFSGTDATGGYGLELTADSRYVVALDPPTIGASNYPNKCLSLDAGIKLIAAPGDSISLQINLADATNFALLPSNINYILEQDPVNLICKLKLSTGEVLLTSASSCSSLYLVITLCNVDILPTSGNPVQIYSSRLIQSLQLTLNKQVSIYLIPQANGIAIDLSSIKKLDVLVSNFGPSTICYLDFATVFAGGVLDPSSWSRQYTFSQAGANFQIPTSQTPLLRAVSASNFTTWGFSNFLTGENDPVNSLNCPDGTYLSDRFGCAACHPACGKCFGESHTQCKTCTPTSFEPVPGSLSSCSRVNAIPYGQTTSGVSCPQNCDLCGGPDNKVCVACISGSYLNEGYATCGPCNLPGYYIARNNLCKKCHSNCLTCDDEGSMSCTSCPTGKVLSEGGECTACTKPGTFYSNGNCSMCHKTCSTCTGPAETDCVTCPTDTYLHRNHTCGDCPEQKGLFFNSLVGYCETCDPSCRTCSGSSSKSCLTCFDGYQHVNSSCIQKAFKIDKQNFDNNDLAAYLEFEFPIGKIDLSVLKQSSSLKVYPGLSEEQVKHILKVSGASGDKRVLTPAVLTETAGVDYSFSYYGDRTLKLQLKPTESSLEKSTVVVELLNKSLLAKDGDLTTVYPERFVVIPEVEYTYTNLDRFLDNSVFFFKLTNSVLLLLALVFNRPQAVLFLRLLQQMRSYLLVSMFYPTNYERLVWCLSSNPLTLFPNLLAGLGDEDGLSLPPRFPRYEYSLHVLKSLGSLASLAMIVALLKASGWLASKTPSKWLSRVGRNIDRGLGPEFWFGFIEANHIDIILSILIFVAQRESLPARAFDKFLIVLSSLTGLSLLSFYLFVYRKVLSLHNMLIRLAILEVDELPEEPFGFLLRGKQELVGMFRRHFGLSLLLRDVLVAVLIYSAKYQGVVFASLRLPVNLFFVGMILGNKPYKNRLVSLQLNAQEGLCLLLDVLYLVLASMRSDLSEKSRYNGFGYLMMVIITGLHVGFCTFGAFITVQQRRLQKERNKIISNSSTRSAILGDLVLERPGKRNHRKVRRVRRSNAQQNLLHQDSWLSDNLQKDLQSLENQANQMEETKASPPILPQKKLVDSIIMESPVPNATQKSDSLLKRKGKRVTGLPTKGILKKGAGSPSPPKPTRVQLRTSKQEV